MIFYFTTHPQDMIRTRIPAGSHIMLVASAFWDARRRAFKMRTPPPDHFASITIDSGGFTAAKRWGRYPWSMEQYIDFVRNAARDLPLDFVACMDYACERGVNREDLATNRERILATIENDHRLRALAPDLPWLSVLQGNSLQKRLLDLHRRRKEGLLFPYMGIGSICGRREAAAAATIRFLAHQLPHTRFHAFGLDARTLDRGDDVALAVRSWDSYAWSWARGHAISDRPNRPEKREDENSSEYTLKLAQLYRDTVVLPRLSRLRQPVLL